MVYVKFVPVIRNNMLWLSRCTVQQWCECRCAFSVKLKCV